MAVHCPGPPAGCRFVQRSRLCNKSLPAVTSCRQTVAISVFCGFLHSLFCRSWPTMLPLILTVPAAAIPMLLCAIEVSFALKPVRKDDDIDNSLMQSWRLPLQEYAIMKAKMGILLRHGIAAGRLFYCPGTCVPHCRGPSRLRSALGGGSPVLCRPDHRAHVSHGRAACRGFFPGPRPAFGPR